MKKIFIFTALLGIVILPFGGIALSARVNPVGGALYLVSFLAPADVPAPLNGMGFPQ